MARILYAVQGEGMGHAVRSSVIIKHLLKKHQLVIASSGRAYKFLSKKFKDVYDIYGCHIVYRNNAVDNLKTFFQNMKKLPEGSIDNIRKLVKLMYNFRPQLIISDFEPFSYFLGSFIGIPVIGIDNIHVATRCKIHIPKRYRQHYRTPTICPQSLGIQADHYLITTYFHPKRKNPGKVSIVPPVVRDEIVNAKPAERDFVLVYQTSKSYNALIKMLSRIDQRFVVYGFNRKRSLPNVKFKEFHENGFVKDLANCKAVIANGGFGVISEALYLKKPVLSVPVKKNFEQVTNAVQLQELGYGKFYDELNARDIEEFLLALPLYKKNLEGYNQQANTVLLKKLDNLIRRLA